jgi:hypothetical protein
MQNQVKWYVENCQTCQEAKSLWSKTLALLEPLLAPCKVRDSILIDCVKELHEDSTVNTILAVVNRFSVMALFMSTTKQVSV